ncbi:hypothetical protein TARUN_439 [Trichoderma arundinaceum]|uniref:Transcription factor Iwr1 domain-containing protein n=1 Tax=Trichoderma arundinaceum TaxID=490622 RepID=A0A395P0K7_TRIAR|nr:hypothetical protein TARUN_439 [Trichoderma arundinaceum]
MSIPPQLIRVKRKRDDDSPVTFLQLDEGAKRHRSEANWVYQRRESKATATGPAVGRSDGKPVIHVSQPEVRPSPTKTRTDGRNSGATGDVQRPTKRPADGQLPEQRTFHVSRAMLAQASATQGSTIPASSKHVRYGPTIFVERTGRKKIIPKSSRQSLVIKDAHTIITKGSEQEMPNTYDEPIEQRHLKKPGVAKRRDPSQEPPARVPLPQSLAHRHGEDMDRITADMNQWVLNEIGANLHAMEVEKRQAEKPRFKPKAPMKRYQERHPDAATSNVPSESADTPMADASEEEGDDEDWIIEEYIRIPAHSMGLNVPPSDVGILVLNGEEESMLFYGPPQDEDEEYAEDDEDENAENYYTADYPEDEVDTEDEFDRHAYMYRNANASDEEEFDDNEYDSDEIVMEGQDDDDDDARMDRIREFMKRNAAFRGFTHAILL